MSKFVFFFILGISLSFGSTQASNTPRVVQGKTFITYGKSLKDIPLNSEHERAFSVDAVVAAEIFQSGAPSLVINDFPVGLAEAKTIELRPARTVVDGQTKWMISRKDGMRPAKTPRIISYEGRITGENSSRIYLTYSHGEFIGMIERSNGIRYVVAPNVNNYSSKREHLLTNEQQALTELGNLGAFCSVPEDHSDAGTSKHTENRILSNDLLEVRVALEANYNFYKKFKNAQDPYEAAAAYIASVFGMVSRVYENEVNVVFSLNVVSIVMDPAEDPYAAITDPGQILPMMKTHWNNNITDPRDLAHLMTGPSSTSVGGIAYRETLCKQNQAYGVSGIETTAKLPGLTYTWDIMVVAHEIGHNFGSQHTHHASWSPPLDTCVTKNGPYPTDDAATSGTPKPPASGVATIMSYCHLQFANTVQLIFGDRPGQVIRAGAESCLKSLSNPTILMQYPVGMQNLVAGKQEEIRWTSAKVASVKVQYSTNGSDWIDINTNVLASERKTTWSVPAINTTTLLVRVSDASNPNIYDQTEATLSIAAAALSLTSPTGGERIGQKESVTITWNKQLVTAVNIQYSANGQEPWTSLASGVTTTSYKWTVPTISTSNAVIRVTDAANGSLVSQSAPFAIGTATATLTRPNGGELWGKTAKVWITWTSDFVSKIKLEYSVNNGGQWKGIKTGVNPTLDASSGGYLWTVPEDPADNQVLVRVNNAATPDKEELDRSNAPFTLDLVSSVEDPVAELNGLLLTGISPNPSGDEAYVKFTTSETIQGNSLQVEVINVAGQVIARFDQANQFTSGEQSIKLDLKGLPQGVYLLVLKSGTTQVSAPLQIVR